MTEEKKKKRLFEDMEENSKMFEEMTKDKMYRKRDSMKYSNYYNTNSDSDSDGIVSGLYG